MERLQSINLDRLRWCCEDRGISLQELASKAGIKWSSFEKMLVGKSNITINQLQKVASVLNRGLLFFLEPSPVIYERVHTPQFRTIANQKPELSASLKSLIERVEKQREIYLSLQEDLEEDAPRFEPPDLHDQDVPRSAAIAREWLQLEDTNTFDSYRKAVEAKGILVIRSSGYKGKWQIDKEETISGFTLYHSDCPCIVIRKAAESRQAFTLMHELGHVLLHRDSFIDEFEDLYSYQGKEREASSFAGNLLVPDAFLEQIDDNNRPDDVRQYDGWLYAYRKSWSVSGEVILIRLLNKGRISQSELDAYQEWTQQIRHREQEGGSRKYRYREPKHLFGETFVQTVLDALHAKQISLAKASTYLDNLKISDVHRLESYYAGL